MKFTRFCTIFRYLDSSWMLSSLLTKAKIKTKTNNTTTTTTTNSKKKKTKKDGERGRILERGKISS